MPARPGFRQARATTNSPRWLNRSCSSTGKGCTSNQICTAHRLHMLKRTGHGSTTQTWHPPKKIPGWHFGPCLAFWFVLSKSPPAVGFSIELADNTQLSYPTPNPNQQLTALLCCLTSYSQHDGLLTHLSYLGLLSVFPLHLCSVTSSRAGVGLNTPTQTTGRGCRTDSEQVLI